jgi:hypothetical protein
MSTTNQTVMINLYTMNALLPVLARLDGYAMQKEPVNHVVWADTHDEHGNPTGEEIIEVSFPNGDFRKVMGGWCLSINGAPSAVFPA